MGVRGYDPDVGRSGGIYSESLCTACIDDINWITSLERLLLSQDSLRSTNVFRT